MSKYHGMVRSAYMFDTDAVSNETALDTGEDAVTQQCFKDECDINILLAKFAVTGQLPDNVRVPQFVDFEEAFDFQSSMNVIRAAEEAFNAMPAEVRDRFQNDPGWYPLLGRLLAPQLQVVQSHHQRILKDTLPKFPFLAHQPKSS